MTILKQIPKEIATCFLKVGGKVGCGGWDGRKCPGRLDSGANGKSRASVEQSLDCLLILLCSPLRMALSLFILNAQYSELRQQVAPEAAIW